MGTKTRTTMRSDIRTDLDDASTILSDNELNRAIERAVWEISRFFPQELYKEYTLDFTVTDEAWTADAAGTYVALANKPIKWDSEKVVDPDDNACTRDTDYTMDYTNGKITIISGGEIDDEDECTISYVKNQVAIDISGLTDLIRIEEVHYMVGDVPANIQSDLEHGGILWIYGDVESQARLTDKKHIMLRYSGYHTAPTDSVAGTLPIFFEEIVINLAEAYALFNKSVTYYFQATTDNSTAATTLTYAGDNTTGVYKDIDTALDAAIALLTADGDVDVALNAAAAAFAAAGTALGKIDTTPDTNLTDAVTALDAVASVLVAGGAHDLAAAKIGIYLYDNANEDAVYWLTKITTDIADLRTAFGTAVDTCNAVIDKIDTVDFLESEAAFADEELHIRENIVQGTATSTAAFTCTDTAAAFVAADVGKLLFNRTDDTWAVICKITSGTVVELSHDIMASGEEYLYMFPQAAAMLGFSILDINSITVGADVPERFMAVTQASFMLAQQYATRRMTSLQQGGVRAQMALAYIQEAAARLQNFQSYINQATAWATVADGFGNEARIRAEGAAVRLQEAGVRIELALAWVAEAQSRVAIGQGYIMEAEQRLSIAFMYMREAETRLGLINGFVAESAQYQQIALVHLQLADRFRLEAQARRDEAWAVLRDPKQFVSEFSFSSTYQPASYGRIASGTHVS